jgi:hypothetical protein
MATTPLNSIPCDPTSTVRDGELRIGKTHPHFAADPQTDPLTLRLLFLLRANPGLVKFRADDISGLDEATKKILIAQIDKRLGLDKPAPDVLDVNG